MNTEKLFFVLICSIVLGIGLLMNRHYRRLSKKENRSATHKRLLYFYSYLSSLYIFVSSVGLLAVIVVELFKFF